jgi:hypothetical protein
MSSLNRPKYLATSLYIYGGNVSTQIYETSLESFFFSIVTREKVLLLSDPDAFEESKGHFERGEFKAPEPLSNSYRG